MDTKTRCALSAAVGLIAFVLFVYRFQPYSARGRAQTGFGFVIMTALALLAGLAFTIGLARRRFVVAACFTVAMLAANAVMIVADCAADPASHNLFPFEFIGLAIVSAPAFLGAAASKVIDRVRRGSA